MIEITMPDNFSIKKHEQGEEFSGCIGEVILQEEKELVTRCRMLDAGYWISLMIHS